MEQGYQPLFSMVLEILAIAIMQEEKSGIPIRKEEVKLCLSEGDRSLYKENRKTFTQRNY